ncbi:MAG: DUF1963 domain-containing protein [Desulfovibrio sp.]|nr:MAG: DUF1963 domain-containing protein [Desulfovibrio sp.]
MDRQVLAERLGRKAIVLEVGGFRPEASLAENPLASWFGQVSAGRPDEKWPTHKSRAMWPLLQLNLTELPFRPSGLEDVAFLTVFIGPNTLPVDTPNGDRWCLRTYATLEELETFRPPHTTSTTLPFPMRPKVIDADFPCPDDLDEESLSGIDLEPDWEEEFIDTFENHPGVKLGGWPTLIQNEIVWPDENLPAEPRYVLQIDTVDKAHWMWGDAGVGYFGRGTAAGHDQEWFMTWQCY